MLEPGSEFEVLQGRGVRARWDEHEVLVGSRRLLQDFDVEISLENVSLFGAQVGHAETVVYVAHQRRLVGLIAISVQVRPEARRSTRQTPQGGRLPPGHAYRRS